MEENHIIEIEDLEDRLAVMEGIVEELKETDTKFQKQIVRLMQLLSQYIRLEDQILSGIMDLSKLDISESQQNDITNATARFNEYGSDFQDTWTQDMWEIYNSIRSGFGNVVNKTDISSNINDAVNIALTLAKPNTGSRQSNYIKTLVEVDEMTRNYRAKTVDNTKPTRKTERVTKRTTKCLVF